MAHVKHKAHNLSQQISSTAIREIADQVLCVRTLMFLLHLA